MCQLDCVHGPVNPRILLLYVPVGSTMHTAVHTIKDMQTHYFVLKGMPVGAGVTEVNFQQR